MQVARGHDGMAMTRADIFPARGRTRTRGVHAMHAVSSLDRQASRSRGA
jgi:hypothetical protein